jgi:hypothetical protein
MDSLQEQALRVSGWALEKADPGGVCLRCRGSSGSEKLVKVTFRATNGVVNLGPWGTHFCIICLNLFTEGSPPQKLFRPHAC